MGPIFEQIITLFVFLIAGYILTYKKILPDNTASMLSKLEVYVFLAAMNFRTFAKNFSIPNIKANAKFMLVSVVILVITIVMGKLMAKLFSKDKYEQGVFSYIITIPNYGYMGYALMEGVYGSDMLFKMMMFVLPISFFTYSEGYRVLTNKDKISVKNIINPIIIAIFLGCIVGLCGIKMPAIADTILSKAGSCMAPVSMILTGSALAHYKLKDMLCDVKLYIVSILRLIIIPVIFIFGLKLLNIETNIITVAAVTLAMPVGLNTVVFPKLLGKDSRIGAGAVIISNILMIATIPLVLSLV